MRLALFLGICSLSLVPQLAQAGPGLSSARQAAQEYLARNGGQVTRARQRIGDHIVEGLVFEKGGLFPEGKTRIYVISPGRNATGELALDVGTKNGKVPTRGTNHVTRLFDLERGRLVHDSTRLHVGLNEMDFDRGTTAIVHTAWTPNPGGGNRVSKSGRDAHGRFTAGAAKPAPVAKAAVVHTISAELASELELLAKSHGIPAGGGVSAAANAAITKLTDHGKIQEAGRFILTTFPIHAPLLLPFAIHSAGTPFGVQPGTEAAWRAVLAEHDLE